MFKAGKLANRTNPMYIRGASNAKKKAFNKALGSMQSNKARSDKFLQHIKK